MPCVNHNFSKFAAFFIISATLLLFNLPSIISSTAFSSCSYQQFLDGTPYSRNLDNLLDYLVENTTVNDGFTEATLGASPDAVHGMALCRGDLTPTQCQECVNGAVDDASSQCPGSRSVALWYDECRIRYSDKPFFGTLTQNVADPFYYALAKLPERRVFRLRIEKLLRDLQGRAAYGENSNMFAASSMEYVDNQNLYGLVQCTRDLSGDQCSKCLDAPITQVVCCQQSADLTFLGGSCYLRYSLKMFYNQSLASPPSTITKTVDQTTTPPHSKSYKKPITATGLVLIIIGATALTVLLLAIFLKIKLNRKPKHILLGKNLELQESRELKFHRGVSGNVSLFQNRTTFKNRTDSPKIDLHTLKRATDNFADSKRLGRGEFGPTFKGDFQGREFVVKRLTGRLKVDLELLRREFKLLLKKTQHPNLVRLLGFYLEDEDKLLINEYLPNASLDKILFDPKRRMLLDWGRRYRIIEGVAQGLLHLHVNSALSTAHQNLKASNILLDRNMNPKISDFCLAELFTGSQTQGGTRRAAVAQGYLEKGTTSAKSDIYSFGVLVLEIVTGQRNRDFLGPESSTNLLNYVWQYWKEEKVLQVLDWSLGELYKAHQVLRCIHIALLCVQKDANERPNISTIVKILNTNSKLPTPSLPYVMQVGRTPDHLNLLDKAADQPRSHAYDWNAFNNNVSELSPRTPDTWSQIELDSKGYNV